jgi:hypothetical protein
LRRLDLSRREGLACWLDLNGRLDLNRWLDLNRGDEPWRLDLGRGRDLG